MMSQHLESQELKELDKMFGDMHIINIEQD